VVLLVLVLVVGALPVFPLQGEKVGVILVPEALPLSGTNNVQIVE